IRTTALDFALELQSSNPDAGTVDGPTVQSDPALQGVVYNFTNVVIGDGANIAAGAHNDQHSHVEKGDVEALRREAQKVLADADDVNEFIDAITEEQDIESGR